MMLHPWDESVLAQGVTPVITSVTNNWRPPTRCDGSTPRGQHDTTEVRVGLKSGMVTLIPGSTGCILS